MTAFFRKVLASEYLSAALLGVDLQFLVLIVAIATDAIRYPTGPHSQAGEDSPFSAVDGYGSTRVGSDLGTRDEKAALGRARLSSPLLPLFVSKGGMLKGSFVLILLTISPTLLASKPTAQNRTEDERREITSLKFSSANNLKNFRKNLSRDCNGNWYSTKDRDLQVTAILRSYPKNFGKKFLETMADSICPLNLLRLQEYVGYEKDIIANYLLKRNFRYRDMDSALDLLKHLEGHKDLTRAGYRLISIYKKKVSGGDFPDKVKKVIMGKTGSIMITSVPSGLTVKMDGKKIGITPFSGKQVPVGPHNITLSSKIFGVRKNLKIDVTENGKTSRELVFQRGLIRVLSRPSATVHVNGVSVGITPLNHPLYEGKYEIKLLTNDGREETRIINMKGGKKEVVKIVFR